MYIKGSSKSQSKSYIVSQGEHTACSRDSPVSFGVSFVCDKTPLADHGAIAAYERVLCSTLIYKCAESFCRVSMDLD